MSHLAHDVSVALKATAQVFRNGASIDEALYNTEAYNKAKTSLRLSKHKYEQAQTELLCAPTSLSVENQALLSDRLDLAYQEMEVDRKHLRQVRKTMRSSRRH
jgi:hypothetical protein